MDTMSAFNVKFEKQTYFIKLPNFQSLELSGQKIDEQPGKSATGTPEPQGGHRLQLHHVAITAVCGNLI